EVRRVNDGQQLAPADGRAANTGAATVAHHVQHSELLEGDSSAYASEGLIQIEKDICTIKPTEHQWHDRTPVNLSTSTLGKETVFGRIYISTKSWDSGVHDAGEEHNGRRHTIETAIRFHPSQWLVKC